MDIFKGRCSLACLRCRRSKTRCENDGTAETACERCTTTGGSCDYPPKQVKKASALPKKPKAILSNNTQETITMLLSQPFMEYKVWEEIFQIFRDYFGLELSFIHYPDLTERVARSEDVTKKYSGVELIMFGVMTLAVEYHKQLPKYFDHLLHNYGISELVTLFRLALKETIEIASINALQGFLMLSLYEWNHGNSSQGRLFASVAVNMARELKLGIAAPDTPVQPEEAIIQELERRTMFSCYIIDCIVGSRDRPPYITSSSLLIRLPCGEREFDLGLQVETSSLETICDKAIDGKDGLHGWFIKLVEMWRAMQVLLASRSAGHPDSLSSNRIKEYHFVWALTTSNHFKRQEYIGNRYISLHMLALDCELLRCAIDITPMSASTILTRNAIQSISQAAQDILVLAESSGEKLPSSWFILHAVWTATLITTYLLYFPRIDITTRITPTDRSRGIKVLEKSDIPFALNYASHINCWKPVTGNGQSEWQRLIDIILEFNPTSSVAYFTDPENANEMEIRNLETGELDIRGLDATDLELSQIETIETEDVSEGIQNEVTLYQGQYDMNSPWLPLPDW
jgi:hypothetical protein